MSSSTVIFVTNEKGCLGSLLNLEKYFYFLAGALGAGAAGFAAPVPSTGSTLINSTSKIRAELPGILF
jgi:hypothetical protein